MTREWKVKAVQEIKKLLSEYPTVLIVGIEGIPSDMFRRARIENRDLVFKVSRKRLIERALKESGKEALVPYMEGSVGLVFSRESPVSTAQRLLKYVEHKALAPGQISPVDVVVPAGPTGIPPGPAMTELKEAGIPVKIGKGVEVIEDFMAVRAGERVSTKMANALMKLGIKPIEVRFRILAGYSDGLVYPGDVLAISPEDVLSWMSSASAHALNLAFGVQIPVPQVLRALVTEAHNKAYNLSVVIGYVTPDNVKDILARAHLRALALKEKIKGGEGE